MFGVYSDLAARAALAADKQGAYAATHARLMRTSFVVTPAYVEAMATDMGLDAPRLSHDMRDPAVDAALARAGNLARVFGMVGTPTLVVGSTMVEGAVTLAQLEALIALERDAGASGPCAGG